MCGLCAGPCEWISLSILPSPIPELQHAPLPLKVLWARERVPTPPSSAVFHLDSHLSPSRSWECVKFPFWKLESQWTPESSEGNFKGQNPLDWKITYNIEKLLKRRCLKWACMTHFDIWNTSYGQKKGWESNWQLDSQPLKVGNCYDFLACRWHATYCWKSLNEGYNFALDLISIKGLHAKLWGPKVARVPTLAILGLPGQNAIWMWASWRGTEYTIKGKKVVACPKSRPWWVLWVWGCPWLTLTPKVLKLCTNQLVVWFVHICVND